MGVVSPLCGRVTFATVSYVENKPMQTAARFLSILALLCVAAVPAVWAQPFKLQCEVEGKYADAEGKATAARVGVELQVIGRHLYFTVIGPKPFEMRVSTLVTEEYEGTNLTSDTELGARRKHRASAQETSLLIKRGSMELIAYNDVPSQGKSQRFKYAGKCRQSGT